MASINNSNFYVDIENIETLKNIFNSEIEHLTELFLDLEEEIKRIEDEGTWTGKSYDSFKPEYEKWKMDYLQKLTELLQLKQFLDEVKAVAESLIDGRSKLPSYLEV